MRPLLLCFLFFFFSAFATRLGAQTTDPAIDSLERIMLRDSLQVSDSIISGIFEARNNFLAHTAELTSDTVTARELKKAIAAQYAAQTNKRILKLLGQVKYDHYREMIRRKIESHHLPGTVTPLASTEQ